MTILEVICKTVAIENKSQWPCSMLPIPQLRLVGVRTSYIYFFQYFLDTLSTGPHYKSLFGGPPWLHPVTLPLPWLKAGPQLFNISMKPVKGYRYVKRPF